MDFGYTCVGYITRGGAAVISVLQGGPRPHIFQPSHETAAVRDYLLHQNNFIVGHGRPHIEAKIGSADPLEKWMKN